MEGIIEVSSSGGTGKSVLTRLYSKYPVRLMQQEPWLNYVSVVLMGFGGGMVGGDRNDLRIAVHSGAHLVLRSQGSTKLFKAIGQTTTTSIMKVTVGNNGLFAFVMDPTTCFPGSRYKQQFEFLLSKDASLVMVDWCSAGRQGRDVAWSVEEFTNEIFVQTEEEILFVESQQLRNTSFGNVCTKLGGALLVGCLVLTGPETLAVRERLCALQQRMTYDQVRVEMSRSQSKFNTKQSEPVDLHLPSSIVSVSDLNATSKVVRFAVFSEEEGYELMHEILKPMSEVLVGYGAYNDRLCCRPEHSGPRHRSPCSASLPAGYAPSHPIYILRQHDKLSQQQANNHSPMTE